MKRVEVEFSLALNNRTGKFFAASEMLCSLGDSVDKIRFWRFRGRKVPTGLPARVLGRCLQYEIRARTSWDAVDLAVPRLRPTNPVLFTDPREVILYDLRSTDIVIVHDLGPLTHPQYYADGVEALYKKAYDRIVEARLHVVFVSIGAMEEFCTLFGGDFASMRVIYNPIRATPELSEQIRPEYVNDRFILSVGAIGSRKNQKGLIAAFKKSRLADDGLQLVLAGGPEPGFDDVLREAQGEESVVMLGYVKDAELGWLYANAIGFALPSHLEGFGMPVAEALARDLLPLVSEEGPLAEVAGDEAIKVDPNNVGAIADGLLKLVYLQPEERIRRKLVAKSGLDRFSPEVIAKAWRQAIGQILV